MKILNLKQGSPEWDEHRLIHDNASEASILMGFNKNVSRDDLLALKGTGCEREFSAWFQKNVLDKGHEVEARARPLAVAIVGDDLYPVSATDDDDWLAASYDGQTMDESVNWECKQWNQQKAEDVRNGIIPLADYWQLQHQLLVNPGSKTLYMVTDGTEDNCVYLWVEADPVAQQTLITAWQQFDDDLKHYTPPAARVEVVGKEPAALPVLHVEAKGEITTSNLGEFEAQARAVLDSINMDPQTDQEFATAEKTVKWATTTEANLKAAQAALLKQIPEIDAAAQLLAKLTAETRDIRLALDKTVKAKKDEGKAKIVQQAKAALAEFHRQYDHLDGYLPLPEPNFAGAMKGLKTQTSMQTAVNQALADAKVALAQTAETVRANLALVDETADRAQIADLPALVTKPTEDFAALIQARLAAPQASDVEQPATEELVAVLAQHYKVDTATVWRWVFNIKTQEAA